MRNTFYSKYIKRLLDFILSFIGLVILSPIFLIVAIAIKLESQGPVFFRQERLGKNGNTFKILKFRSMVENAEFIGDGLSIRNEEDNRITRIGRLLRKTSIDEFPQLLNVLKGDMSLVGPRPTVTYHPYDGYNSYPNEFKKRFATRPGITGMAQVRLRNTGSWQDRFVHDLEYVNNISFLLDLKIMFYTVLKVFKSENIYGGQAYYEDSKTDS